METSDSGGLEHGLTEEQIQQYHRDGFLGPLSVFDDAEASSYLEQIRTQILERDRPDDDPLSEREYWSRSDRHRDSRALYDLVTDDRITDKLASIYGRDLLLWFTNVWNKPVDTPAIDWHQELNALSIHPPVCALGWVSLTSATRESGCMEFVPGSHYQYYPHEPVPEDEQFVLTERADTEAFDESEATAVETEPGDLILFNAHTLHRSSANEAATPRSAVNLAVMPPHVSLDPSNDRFLPELKPMVASGRNSASLHETMSPP